jgi:hypothetical protein
LQHFVAVMFKIVIYLLSLFYIVNTKIDKESDNGALLYIYYDIFFLLTLEKEELSERMLVINPSINIKRKYAVHSFVISNERERMRRSNKSM